MIHTDDIEASDREDTNSGIKDYGPLNTSAARDMAAWFDRSIGTVQRWFSPSASVGMVPASAVGESVCEQEGDTLKKLLLAFPLGAAEGLERIPLYTGKPYIYHQACNTLGECARWVYQYYHGEFDMDMGFRWSKGWVNIFVQIGADTGTPWQVTVLYNAMSPEDDSDPVEECPALRDAGDEDDEEDGDNPD